MKRNTYLHPMDFISYKMYVKTYVLRENAQLLSVRLFFENLLSLKSLFIEFFLNTIKIKNFAVSRMKTALNTFFNFKFENILSDHAGPTDGLDSFFSVVNELLEQCIALLKCFKLIIIANGKFKVLYIFYCTH